MFAKAIAAAVAAQIEATGSRDLGPGALRRVERENHEREARNALYASTPTDASESRQVRRRKELLARKASQ